MAATHRPPAAASPHRQAGPHPPHLTIQQELDEWEKRLTFCTDKLKEENLGPVYRTSLKRRRVEIFIWIAHWTFAANRPEDSEEDEE
jgi:hypothetical protein